MPHTLQLPRDTPNNVNAGGGELKGPETQNQHVKNFSFQLIATRRRCCYLFEVEATVAATMFL